MEIITTLSMMNVPFFVSRNVFGFEAYQSSCRVMNLTANGKDRGSGYYTQSALSSE
jgi:hypothetical protein